MGRFLILKKNNDFQRVFEKGHSFSGRYIVVYFLHNCFQNNRYGFAVGKKIGAAVIRNRVKRILREINFKSLPDAISAMDIVIVARVTILKANFICIFNDYQHILDKAKLYFSLNSKNKEES